MQKITPFLWYNNQAEEAVKFYRSIFKKSKVLKTTRYNDASANASGQPKGSVMTVEFTLEGQKFVAINGGPHFKFTEAISFVVNCKNQKEVDWFWKKLTSGGGQPSRCGWLKDKFGVSWQIVPEIIGDLMSDKDPAKAQRGMEAIMQMSKIDIKTLKDAHDGKPSKTSKRKTK